MVEGVIEVVAAVAEFALELGIEGTVALLDAWFDRRVERERLQAGISTGT